MRFLRKVLSFDHAIAQINSHNSHFAHKFPTVTIINNQQLTEQEPPPTDFLRTHSLTSSKSPQKSIPKAFLPEFPLCRKSNPHNRFFFFRLCGFEKRIILSYGLFANLFFISLFVFAGFNHGLIPNQMSHDAICLATTNDEYFVVADDFVDILCIVLDML